MNYHTCQRHNLAMAAVVGMLALMAAAMGFFMAPDYFIPAGMLAFAAFILWTTRPNCNCFGKDSNS
jgi:hypothetical protein